MKKQLRFWLLLKMSTWSRGLCFPQPRTRTICDLISSYKFIFFKHLFLTKILAIWLTFEFNLNIICFRGKMTKFNLECFSIRKLLLKPPRGWPRLSFPVTDSVARKSQPGGGGPWGAGHTAELRPCLFTSWQNQNFLSPRYFPHRDFCQCDRWDQHFLHSDSYFVILKCKSCFYS